MRKFKAFSIFSLLSIAITCYGQELTWKFGYNYFFDNAEYALSTYSVDQTMHGMNLTPEIGWKLDDKQTVFTGVNLMKIYGEPSFTNGEDFLAYYQYKTPKVKFRAGAFPKEDMLDNYSTFFFKDSVRFFRPIMHGLYLKINNSNNDFFNIWMDWTGYGSKNIRESFFIGASGLKRKGVLFGEMQSYLFHFANTTPSTESFNVSEQFQMHLSAGASYSNDTGLDTLGTDNISYFGNQRMSFYDRHGDDLYWGSPFLRGKSYVESKWYAQLIKSDRVNANIGLNMHMSEKQLLFQQTITLSVNINKQRDTKQHTSNMFPLMNFFTK